MALTTAEHRAAHAASKRAAKRWRRVWTPGWTPGEASTCPSLDHNMAELVEALNAVEGVATTGSCGGHAHPTPFQWPAGEWIVTLDAVGGMRAWRRGLALLRHVTAGASDVRLDDRDAVWGEADLCGYNGADPDALAAQITALLEPAG